MTAPAIVLVTSGPEEPGVAETLSTIVTSLRHARRDLKVHIGRVDGEPSISDILAGLASRDVAEFLQPGEVDGADITTGTVSKDRLPKVSAHNGFTSGTAGPSGGADGDIYFQYTV